MSSDNLTDTKNEIKKGLQFLTTLNQNGPVYAMLRPVLDDLKLQIEQSELAQASTAAVTLRTDGTPTRGDYDTIVASIHKAMCQESFICVVEKPSTVPGFAATVRELQPHQLPEGWNVHAGSYSLTYKHRQKSGKHFVLTCSLLLEGAVLAMVVTEKGGPSYGSELYVEEFIDTSSSKEEKDAATKVRVQSLVWQLIPALETVVKAPSTAVPQPVPTPTPQPNLYEDPYRLFYRWAV
eukprot:CAMPEP_0119035086 /NCGR_PEP_ID=MMETSP1177-20130426/2057_1 /TAXON_ID=2985 /ORGANISM="Ochromonas sp, Strain CCMP1899" /LENGTH=236 /DNA_ID=CAMNT_0006992987 /DNA_START=134 /DNA_END=840 /DNA_ORIENTATION=+